MAAATGEQLGLKMNWKKFFYGATMFATGFIIASVVISVANQTVVPYVQSMWKPKTAPAATPTA